MKQETLVTKGTNLAGAGLKNISIKIISMALCSSKSGILLYGAAWGFTFMLSSNSPANAKIETVVQGDTEAEELRSVTIESWDRDYSGQGYGWRVYTDKDAKQNPGTPYSSRAESAQAEREVKLIKGTPVGLRLNHDYDQARVLAVQFAFTFPGNNAVTLAPPKVDHFMNERIRYYLSEAPAIEGRANNSCFQDPSYAMLRNTKRNQAVACVNGVNMPGIVHKISVWVMGRGNDYELEAWLEDWKGNVHVLPMGSVNFVGWRPLSVTVPKSIAQDIDTFPQTKTLILTKLKLRARRSTFVDPVYIFFDELRILASVFQVSFDGSQLNFDSVDCGRKNALYRLLRQHARFPEQWPKIVDCSKAPGPAAPIPPSTR